MPPKRIVKRVVRKRARGTYPRTRNTRIMRQIGGLYKFERRCGALGTDFAVPPTQETSMTVTVGTPQYRRFTFAVAHCPNFAEFVALFDFFRIIKVKTTFSLRASSSIDSTTVSPSPIFYYSIDFNDGTPTSINTLREKRNCKVVYMNDKNKRGFDISLKPILQDTVSTVTQPVNSGWYTCSTAGMNTAFQGLICAVELLGAVGQTSTISYETKYYLEFKGAQ